MGIAILLLGRSELIGDRPETDIKGAAQIGIRTILITTGRFRRGDPYPVPYPKTRSHRKLIG